MAVLSGETIKNAIARELNKIFPDIAVYKEEQTNPFEFPHFFILQLSASSQEDRKDHYFQTFLFNVRYRHIADVELEPRIEQNLDSVGLKLITEFNRITLDNGPYRVLQVNYEKVDKVVHFTFQIKVQVVKEPEDGIKMQKIKEQIIFGNKTIVNIGGN